jgi:hypothetical protein
MKNMRVNIISIKDILNYEVNTIRLQMENLSQTKTVFNIM